MFEKKTKNLDFSKTWKKNYKNEFFESWCQKI